MALNGLDSSKVKEAYEIAQSDGQSWFLLHYLARDQVSLLRQGIGGLDQVRAAIVTYPEKSPLYGFFNYRKSRIIFKYIPEGTSRLLQVRTNVHFEAIIENFGLFDAMFTAHAPDDFNDSFVSATCFPRSDSIQSSSKQSIPQRDSGKHARGGSFPHANVIPESVQEAQERDYRVQESRRNNSIIDTPSTYNLFPTSQFDTRTPGSGSEHHLFTPTEEESENEEQDVIQELPCIEDDAISETSSFAPTNRASSAGLGSQEYMQRHSASDYLNHTSDNFENLRPKVKLFPRPVTDVRVTRSGPDGSTRQKLPAGMRRISTKTEPDSTRTSRASKSPKSARSARAHKARRPIEAAREMDGNSVDEFPTLEDEVAMAPDTSSLPEPTPVTPAREVRAVAPQMAGPTQAAYPSTDFALPPRRTLGGASPGSKAQSNRTTSYGESTFSVLSSEKQRLMRVLELRKATMPMSSSSAGTPVSDHDQHTVQEATEKSVSANADPNISAITPPRNAGTRPTNNPSMSFVHRLMSPVSRQALHIDDDGLPVQAAAGATQSSPPSRNSAITAPLPPKEAEETKSADSESPNFKTMKDKRRTTIEPIQTQLQGDNRDDDSFSDDSLMDELENAKVEEAKPMSIAQSPRSPVFSLDRGDQLLRSGSIRSVMIHSPSRTNLKQRRSEPVLNARPQLETIPSELVQSPYSGHVNTLAISPEEEDGKHSGARDQVLTLKAMKSPASLRPSAPSPVVSNIPGIQTHNEEHEVEALPAMPQPNQPGVTRPKNSNAVLKDAVHSYYNISRLTKVEPPRDQVSVTKIERKIQPPSVDERRRLRVATGDPGQAVTGQEAPVQPPNNTSGSALHIAAAPRKMIVNGLPRTRTLPQPVPKASKKDSKSKSKAKTMSVTSLPRGSTSTDGAMGNKDQGKVSQVPSTQASQNGMANRLLKRISAFPLTTEHPASQQQAEYLRDQTRATSWPQIAPPAVPIGTMDVQLPDTLLWKRRVVEVDGSGNLSLGNTSEESNRGPPRKYRLADFQAPFAPSKDRQETPFSIIFERSEGGNLQFACTDARSHTLALRKLMNLHRAWVAFGQK